MLTPNTLLRMIADAQIALGIGYSDFARLSDITELRWRDLRNGRAKISVAELPKLLKTVGLSLDVTAPHHELFLQLNEDEARALLVFADRYKRDGPKQPHPLRSAVEKLTGASITSQEIQGL